jgi:flavin reductase (DIM6/NTAB) family NADH-FMN oxidoreductase RutF
VNPGSVTPSLDMTDAKLLRRTFGAFASGVSVVTVGGTQPHAMTATSFTWVSLEPPLILICVGRGATMHSSLSVGFFGVSVLASDQEPVARQFADSWRALGSPQFDGVDYQPGRLTGVPLIGGALTRFECELWSTCDGGDHTIFIGKVLSLEPPADDGALLFFRGQFHGLLLDGTEVQI